MNELCAPEPETETERLRADIRACRAELALKYPAEKLRRGLMAESLDMAIDDADALEAAHMLDQARGLIAGHWSSSSILMFLETTRSR